MSRLRRLFDTFRSAKMPESEAPLVAEHAIRCLALDPIALSAVLGIVVAVGSLAALILAARASRIEPMRVLRDE